MPHRTADADEDDNCDEEDARLEKFRRVAKERGKQVYRIYTLVLAEKLKILATVRLGTPPSCHLHWPFLFGIKGIYAQRECLCCFVAFSAVFPDLEGLRSQGCHAQRVPAQLYVASGSCCSFYPPRASRLFSPLPLLPPSLHSSPAVDRTQHS